MKKCKRCREYFEDSGYELCEPCAEESYSEPRAMWAIFDGEGCNE